MLPWLLLTAVLAGTRGDPRGRRGAGRGEGLLALVRELSTSLEAALAASEARVSRLAGEQGKLEQGLQEVRGEVGEVWGVVEGMSEDREGVGRRLSALEERSSTDQMLWRWNTQVCNASIQEVKQKLEEKLALLKVKEEVTVRPSDPTESFTSSRTLPTSSSPMDIFKKFESSLLEYQYDYNYGDNLGSGVVEEEEVARPDDGLLKVISSTPSISPLKVSLPSSSSSDDPVGSLVSQTNSLLRNLSERYSIIKSKFFSTLTRQVHKPVKHNLPSVRGFLSGGGGGEGGRDVWQVGQDGGQPQEQAGGGGRELEECHWRNSGGVGDVEENHHQPSEGLRR